MSSQGIPPFGEYVSALLDPGRLMVWAMTHYIRVCAEAILRGQISAPIFQIGRLRDEAFGRFWVEFTTPPDPNNPPPPRGSSTLIPPLLKTAFGTVLDIGPGTGSQMPLLRSKAISSIYGPEPCTGLHKELRAKAAENGVAEKYHILPCGVAASELLPALRGTGTGVTEAYDSDSRHGVFDTIICVRVLCSVPEMERTVRELYALLKPGGRMLITEHVVNDWRAAKGSVLARVLQAVYQVLGWGFFIGDCCLDRGTEKVLRGAAEADGGWDVVELERFAEWSAMPYLSGILVKKGQ
ncbi:hypothetical protein N7492_000213 [Penicillium capsulatum]|uniref:Methyltransferase type 11 domain-containing protein n=1 Tax=Penicillium capsulatum TaxID=69766 RepID=A0A9W9IRC3_9EURO|nr:hypothetical protein N7492_000213 [Penicillium capsulatum]KAJ6130722.1 hypothetical protein N7512_003502 [Penicillium capsulatum]